jgi:hypothetical protein
VPVAHLDDTIPAMETFEPPKYIEKLIAAINDGAKSAQLGALAFTAIGLFLLATAFSATDEDLAQPHTRHSSLDCWGPDQGIPAGHGCNDRAILDEPLDSPFADIRGASRDDGDFVVHAHCFLHTPAGSAVDASAVALALAPGWIRRDSFSPKSVEYCLRLFKVDVRRPLAERVINHRECPARFVGFARQAG